MTVSCGRSERLEERHQRVLVGFGKLGAVSGAFVACLGVARHGGVVAEELDALARGHVGYERSEEHTSELQSLMRISYAVFFLKQKIEPLQNHLRPQVSLLFTHA